MNTDGSGRIRSRLVKWRIVSPTGADVVSLRDLSPKDRLRVMAPSLFTAANMICGFSAVLLAFREQFRVAAALLAVAIIMDICDGFVARAVGATSPFGVQLDSMADLISFGMAPAVLVHTWALREWPVLSWVFAFFWLGCAAFRLARFNVTVDPLADKRYFIGLPSPGAALVPIATIFALERAHVGPQFVFPMAVSVIPAVLMVTSVRFKSFRSVLSIHRGPKWILVPVVVVLAVGLVFAPGSTGLAVAYGYILTAPLGWATAPLRARWFGPDSVAPARHRLPSVFLSGDDEPAHDEEQVAG
ncbi:MAG: CDP-diacylglycerol--serine O-phosphatidyltransferase [Nostocoides sp.]